MLAETLQFIDRVDGWLTPDEATLLYELARRRSGHGTIIEIGSWKGKSTICLACGARESGNPSARVHAIDPHIDSYEHRLTGTSGSTFDEFKNNIDLAGVAGLVEPIVTTSLEAARSFTALVDLVFIDGSHEYEDVRDDYISWSRRMRLGGIMAFHDTAFTSGPRQVVRKYLYRGRNFRDVKFVQSICYGTYVEKNSVGDRVRNYGMLLLATAYSATAKLDMPMSIRRMGRWILGQRR